MLVTSQPERSALYLISRGALSRLSRRKVQKQPLKDALPLGVRLQRCVSDVVHLVLLYVRAVLRVDSFSHL